MPNEDLKKLQQLESAASPAPWSIESEQYNAAIVAPEAGIRTEILQVSHSALNREGANARLVVELRNAPDLLAEVIELRERARNGGLVLKAVVAKVGAPVEISTDDLERAKQLELYEEPAGTGRVRYVIR